MARPPAPAQKQIHSLIVDTGPLIHNTISISTIIQSAEHIYTTPAIISEIRDAATRSRVETTLLPFLTLRNPTPASYEHVAEFSKKTGDFPVLSRQDLGILALAYEIDEEVKNTKKAEEAAAAAAAAAHPSPLYDGSAYGTTAPDSANALQDYQMQLMLLEQQNKQRGLMARQEKDAAPAEKSKEEEKREEATQSLEEDMSKLAVSAEEAKEEAKPTEESKEDSKASEEAEPSDEDDDDGEWITPSNLKKHQEKDSGVSLQETAATQLTTATMTTDYAMQNVLLQMQLALISPSMHRIKTLRTYTLRCHACFLTTKEMTKQFCPRCGQPTLNRVGCSTNAKGEFKLHLAKNHTWNNRGNKFSVPKPQAGTASGKGIKGGGKGGWGNDLVLAEDQKEFQRHNAEQKRLKTRDLMDDDYLPGILTGERGRQGGRSKVGAGKNINSRKRF